MRLKRFLSSAHRRLKVPLLACLCALSACADRSDTAEQWDNYTAALSRVLDRSASAKDHKAFPHLPPQRDLTAGVEIPTSQINLLEFLRLRECRLAQVLAERNSILGKHADASARLLFNLHFLSNVESCIAQLHPETDRALITALRAAQAQKQRFLPHALYVALLAGPEFRSLWQRPRGEIDYPTRHDDVAVTALNRWGSLQEQWLAHADTPSPPAHWQVDDEEIYALLATIQLGMGGALLAFTANSMAGLDASIDLLQQRLEGRPLCLTGRPTAAARQFQGLLQQQFVGEIQRDASLANRHQYALTTVTEKIEQQIFDAMTARGQVPPRAYLQWRATRRSALAQHLNLQRKHVAAASALLEQCGLGPVNRN